MIELERRKRRAAMAMDNLQNQLAELQEKRKHLGGNVLNTSTNGGGSGGDNSVFGPFQVRLRLVHFGNYTYSLPEYMVFYNNLIDMYGDPYLLNWPAYFDVGAQSHLFEFKSLSDDVIIYPIKDYKYQVNYSVLPDWETGQSSHAYSHSITLRLQHKPDEDKTYFTAVFNLSGNNNSANDSGLQGFTAGFIGQDLITQETPYFPSNPFFGTSGQFEVPVSARAWVRGSASLGYPSYTTYYPGIAEIKWP